MTRIALLLLAVLALALAGCGGGDDDGSDDAAADTAPAVTDVTGERLPKDEFIERGDAICRDLQRKAQALSREAQALAGVPLDDAKTAKAAAEIWRKQVKLVEELDERFDALGPAPEGEETTVRDFRADIDQALTLGRQIAAALEKGDDPTALVGDYTTLIDQSNATAGLIGFKVCGQV